MQTESLAYKMGATVVNNSCSALKTMKLAGIKKIICAITIISTKILLKYCYFLNNMTSNMIVQLQEQNICLMATFEPCEK